MNESFLEDINNLLNSGEVPNIWEPDEKKKILEDIREYNNKLGRVGILFYFLIQDEPDMLYSTFVERVRNNLHIVLCMSPVGDQLRVRCRKFPSLVDCCTLDWFSSWPEDALISVSSSIMKGFNELNQDYVPKLAEVCKEIH